MHHLAANISVRRKNEKRVSFLANKIGNFNSLRVNILFEDERCDQVMAYFGMEKVPLCR